jgi:CRP-like cAMP-binding protein
MLASLKQELQTQPWLPSLIVGVTLGVTMVLTEIIRHQAGEWVGEIDFCTQATYQTMAVAETDSHLYRLTRVALEQMQQDHPQAAVVFTEMLLSVVANWFSRFSE